MSKTSPTLPSLKKNLIRYAKYLYKVKWLFLGAILSGAISASTSAAGIPVIIAKVFPVVFGAESAPEWLNVLLLLYFTPEQLPNAILFTTCLTLPLVFVIRGISMLANNLLVSYVGMRILEYIRLDVFTKLQALPLAFHERQKRGDLISRMLADTQNVQAGITQVANDLIKQPFTFFFALGAVFYLLWEKQQTAMFFGNLVLVAAIIIPIVVFGKRVVQRSRKAQAELGDLASVAQENLASQREIRSYAMEEQQVSLFQTVSKKFLNLQLKTVKYRQLLIPSIEVLSALGLSYILVQGYKNGLIVSDFLALASAIFFAFDSLKRLGVTYNRLKQAQASLERLNSILDEPDTMPDPVHPIEPEKIRGDVRFDHVSFSYDGKNDVLRNVNLHIPSGQVVALVGPSGAGKTTFASLIPRFYEVSTGRVLIDGIDVRDMKKSTLRHFISLVSQHAVLFRNTILENIRLGRRDASNEEVIQAANDAAVLTFASLQAKGINTMLGDTGEGLSGGQRQRVAIARAFLKNAPILILDEATASLDAESENLIQQSLQKLSKNRTTFIVAHRFSTIRHADRILVFSSGNIIGDGSHEELYGSNALYTELYDRQSL